MPQVSSIERLPPDVLEQLQTLLRDPRVTQLDATKRINQILAEDGHPERVTKSSVNRYSVKMDRVGAKLRESRAVAEMWIAKLGAAPQSKVGNLTNEIIRTLTFEVSTMIEKAMAGELEWSEMPVAVRMLKELSIAQEKLERAASENVKRDSRIRAEERETAADKAAAEAKRQGASATTIDALRAAIMQELTG